ncbi:MAG: hypothetical protein R6V17_05145 [Halanaerobacter sp.]
MDLRTKFITRMGLLLALTIGLQLLSHSLGGTILITGSLVNMMLIIITAILAWQGGAAVVKMMQFPQLYHALIGGVAALLFVEILKRVDSDGEIFAGA